MRLYNCILSSPIFMIFACWPSSNFSSKSNISPLGILENKLFSCLLSSLELLFVDASIRRFQNTFVKSETEHMFVIDWEDWQKWARFWQLHLVVYCSFSDFRLILVLVRSDLVCYNWNRIFLFQCFFFPLSNNVNPPFVQYLVDTHLLQAGTSLSMAYVLVVYRFLNSNLLSLS